MRERRLVNASANRPPIGGAGERSSRRRRAALSLPALRWLASCGWVAMSLGILACQLLGSGPPEQSREVRIASLSPALTETVFALGIGSNVVAVSDFCHEPPAVEHLDRVGTVFVPRYEDLVRSRPTVVLAERVDGAKTNELGSLCDVATFRWLTFEDVIASTRELGKRFARGREAARLVADYEDALRVAPSARPLKVLLALAHVPGQLSEIWYVRRNSFHGRALEAAGATNAAVWDVVGPPRMTLEEVVRLDPDAIIVLEQSDARHVALLEDWRRMSAIRAVHAGRLALVAAPELQVPGPRIRRLVERLRLVLEPWKLANARDSSNQVARAQPGNAR